MSFYKITDPNERRRMFEKLAKTKKNVRDNLLADKIGLLEASDNLKTFFKPVTESQGELKEQLKEQIRPIKEKVLALPQTQLTIQPTVTNLMNVGPIAKRYLERYLSRTEGDQTFGLRSEQGVWKMGDKEIRVNGDDIIVGDQEYQGTPGLWELIVKDKPSEGNYTEDDLRTYAQILIRSNAMRRDNDPDNPYPKASRGWKWTNIVKPIWNNRNRPTYYEGQGRQTVIIPSDPNALIERLDVLMASKRAGNTGTRNELVSICDELLRQNAISKNEYKNVLRI